MLASSQTKTKSPSWGRLDQTHVLIVSPATANALAPHAAERSWVMFVQVQPPIGVGPVKIEGVRGKHIGERLAQLAADNAFDTMLIGLIPTTNSPHDHANAIAQQYASAHLHDGWFTPDPGLLAFIQHAGLPAIQELLAQTHPAALAEEPVGIDELAEMLGVAPITIRRMVKAEQIPYLRVGLALRFVPRDVIATLRVHRR